MPVQRGEPVPLALELVGHLFLRVCGRVCEEEANSDQQNCLA